MRLQIQGEDPFPCSVSEFDSNELEFTFSYPEKIGGGSDRGGERNGVRYADLDLRLRYHLGPCSMLASLWITNRWMRDIAVDVGWSISADFADLGEAHGQRQQRAPVETIGQPSGVVLRYMHPQLALETHIAAQGGGVWSYGEERLAARVRLARQSTVPITLRVQAVDRSEPMDEGESRKREKCLESWRNSIASLEAPGDVQLASMTNKSLHDIGSMALLEGREEEWLTPAAGVPMFPSLWGRDALTAVWQATAFDRGQLADATLSRIGRLQGTRIDPWRDEEPGRIIRAAQRGPLARLTLNPFDRYYGDFASPFDFILALGQLYAWSGEKPLLAKHWDIARRIMDWARARGDSDRDGYLEYQTKSKAGPTHQGWRDSENAVVDENGSAVSPPIAPCEIQGYYFAALEFMAAFSLVFGKLADARAYWKHAKALKRHFNRDFWMQDEDCLALGLDANKRQIRTVSSSSGQCLTTGIVDRGKLPRLARRLFQPDLFSGWGRRTLSARHPAYNPLSYRLGSVWPVENGTILFGLRRFGFDREAMQLAGSLHDLALLWKRHRIPECVGGYARDEFGHPGAYPQANVLQTWNQSVLPILVQTLLGIWPIAALETLVVYPALPDWAPEIIVRRLRVGKATVSLRFYRNQRGQSHFDVIDKIGTLHVVRQPPFDSLAVGIGGRLRALADGL